MHFTVNSDEVEFNFAKIFSGKVLPTYLQMAEVKHKRIYKRNDIKIIALTFTNLRF